MPQYQIEKISETPPNSWNNPKGGVIYYHRVKLVGHEKAVSIGKQKLNSLTVGQMVDGDIIPNDGPEDKWKATPMQQAGGFPSYSASPSPSNSLDTQESIARSVALKAAVDFTTDGATVDYVLGVADDFLAWLQNKPVQASLPVDDGFGPAPEPGFDGETINMNDISF